MVHHDLSRRALLGVGLAAFVPASGCHHGASVTVTGGPTTLAFPTVETTALTARSRRLLDVLQEAYTVQREFTVYSDGAQEPWCADFVSWALKQAGQPLVNPHTGGWRIPGTMTLLEHFRQTRVWHAADSGYRPVFGDVAIYDGHGPFGQHTNFVLTLDGDQLTTLGGNEGSPRLTVSTHGLDEDLRALGFAHRS